MSKGRCNVDSYLLRTKELAHAAGSNECTVAVSVAKGFVLVRARSTGRSWMRIGRTGLFFAALLLFLTASQVVEPIGAAPTVKQGLPGPRLTLVEASAKPGADEPLYAGDVVVAAYTLRNVGTATASSVELRVIECPPEVAIIEMSSSKDLNQGSTGTWQVKMRPDYVGEFKVALSFYMRGAKLALYLPDGSQKDVFNVALNVGQKPASLVLRQVLNPPDAGVHVGDVVTVYYVVENAGDQPATNVEIRVVSVPPEIEVVEVTALKDLQPGAIDMWQVGAKASQPGIYEITVEFYLNGEKANLNVEGKTKPADQLKFTMSVSEKPFLQAYGRYLLVGIVAIVVIAVVVFVVRRMRRRSARPSAAPVQAPAKPRRRDKSRSFHT